MNAFDHNFALFEVAAKALLWKDGKLLLLIGSQNGHYDFPGGRMDDSEKDLSLTDILAREIAEELGETIKFKVNDVAFVTKRYYQRDGKEHNILATYFNVDLISGDIVLSDEHTEFSWIDPKSILSHPENFITPDEYEQYKKYFEKHGW